MSYWLADRNVANIISKVKPYHTDGMVWNSSCPMMQTWLRNTFAYYSNVIETDSFETSLLYEGELGELVRMMVPQARSLIRQLVTLITKQKLAFKATAERRGSDVVQETRLGNALAGQIVRQEDLDLKGEELCEMAFVQGMAFLEAGWRTDRGELRALNDGVPIFSGDLDIGNLTVFDVLWNTRLKNWANQIWIETRGKVHRWSLIAQIPHLRNQIMALPSAAHQSHFSSFDIESIFEEDMVWVYKIYHAKTPALPQGRLIIYSDEQTVYYDGINPYGCIPVEPMIPERISDMTLGYPILSNLLPCQEMLDHSFSAIATNQSATAVQNVAVPRGANLTYEHLAGMNWYTYDPQPGIANGGKPEGINLSNSSQDTWKFLPVLMEHMQQLSNISSALRGAPPAGVTAGRAIATLVANALEFITSAEKSYTKTMEKVMMHGIGCYRRFVKTEHLVHFAGKNFESYSKEFVGTDLDPIKSMDLQRVSAMMQTPGGRMELVEMMQKGGHIRNPQHLLQILEGGHPLESYETELSEEDLVASENERLMDGQPVLGLNSDDHAYHFRKHMALLNDPHVRNDNSRAEGILEHAFWHFEQAKETDPFLMAMARTGKIPEGGPPPQEPPPSPGLPPPPGGGGGAPSLADAAGGGESEGMPAEPAQDDLGRVA